MIYIFGTFASIIILLSSYSYILNVKIDSLKNKLNTCSKTIKYKKSDCENSVFEEKYKVKIRSIDENNISTNDTIGYHTIIL